jgi:NADH:ubiquinone oxidoreductase subunit F (NADH-binding)
MAEQGPARWAGPRPGPDPSSSDRILNGLRGERLGLQEHRSIHGPAPRSVSIDEVERAGLRGRGGGAFPTAIKMRAVASARGRTVVVANGSEGEPASTKDKLLLAYLPHLVIDGAVAAAGAVGADEVIICVPRGARAAVGSVERAVWERSSSRSKEPRISVEHVPDRYVAGEESALVHWLNGGPAKPTFIPPRPFQKGVRGRPTLMQNVETLAGIALVALHGSAWYRAIGDVQEPGTRLVTLSGAVARPGVYEVPCGITVASLVEHAGGASAVQAFLFGGYFGSWIEAERAWQLPLTESALRHASGALGCGVVVALPTDACGVLETARVARYLSNETAGQCGPCVHGLGALARDLELLAAGAHLNAGHLQRLIDQVKGRGACHHPDGALRFITSAMRVFSDDVARHRRGESCRARSKHPVLPVPATTGEWR